VGENRADGDNRSQNNHRNNARHRKGALSRGFNARSFHVWADGSARNEGRHMGAGWVIVETTPGRERELRRDSVKVTEPVQNGTSVFAELAAATGALNAVPAGSRVRLHLDCAVVVETLQTGTIERHLGAPKRHADMRIAASKLFNAVARHEKVEVVQASDKYDQTLRAAHHLAKRASRAGFDGRQP
jgi:ribonuclease HI